MDSTEKAIAELEKVRCYMCDQEIADGDPFIEVYVNDGVHVVSRGYVMDDRAYQTRDEKFLHLKHISTSQLVFNQGGVTNERSA